MIPSCYGLKGSISLINSFAPPPIGEDCVLLRTTYAKSKSARIRKKYSHSNTPSLAKSVQ